MRPARATRAFAPATARLPTPCGGLAPARPRGPGLGHGPAAEVRGFCGVVDHVDVRHDETDWTPVDSERAGDVREFLREPGTAREDDRVLRALGDRADEAGRAVEHREPLDTFYR